MKNANHTSGLQNHYILEYKDLVLFLILSYTVSKMF